MPDFAQKEIAVRAPKAWDDAVCPTDLLREMGALGLLGMLVPEEWGGIGMTTVGFVAEHEREAGRRRLGIVVLGSVAVLRLDVVAVLLRGAEVFVLALHRLRPLARTEHVLALTARDLTKSGVGVRPSRRSRRTA